MQIIPSRTTVKSIDAMLMAAYDPNEPRKQHQGIFAGCLGDIPDTIPYLGLEVNVRLIEQLLLDEYEIRDIGFPTWQEFVREWSNTWNREFLQLAENLKNAQALTVIDSKETETISEKTNAQSNTQGTSDNKYTDTPNQYNAQTQVGLTRRAINDGNSSYDGEGTREYNRELSDSGNVFERWLELSAINRNIIYAFIDKFRWLFQSTYIIR